MGMAIVITGAVTAIIEADVVTAMAIAVVMGMAIGAVRVDVGIMGMAIVITGASMTALSGKREI